MSDDAIAKAAADIRKAWEDGAPIEPVRNTLPEGDVDAAYRVQQTNTAHWVAGGRASSGARSG